ncbi:MAG: S8 family serine peptidase, partial [Eubacterium sp.]|nr:S8 family serine peptidase [Eubacterium sp.]
MNKLLSIVLSIALFCSPIVYTSAAETPTVDKYLNLEDGTYEDGTVLVTMLSPDDAPLAREGTASFDSQIQIENSYDFGELSTDNLTDGEKNFLSDKSVKVAQVSSTKYSTEELIDKLDSSAYVLSVEPDYCIQKMSSTNDPLSDSQWALDGGGKFNGTTKGISYSRKPQANSSDTPVVAIVDTGIDYTNEDIKDNIWVNPYPNQLPGLYGYDFGDNDIDPLDSSEDSHGTHCAGTIAASADNQLGIAGVASNVKLMGLKVFDASEKANTSYVISAFNYIYQAKQLGVNVVAVNCSWGGNNSSTAFKTIVEQLGNAGVLFVFAAGNSAINHDTSSVICPYDLNTSYTVTVGASTANDLPASFSDYGKSTVDLFAPGEKIVSTVGANIFYPALYPEATQQNMTTYTNSGRQDETMLLHPSSIGMSDHSVDYQTIQHSTEDFFDRSDNGSQYIAFRASSITTSSLYLYLDVTDLNLTTSSI